MKCIRAELTVIDIVLAVIFIVFSFGLMFLLLFKTGSGDVLKITANGNEYLYQLNINKTITVRGTIGDTVIEIKNGKYRFVESACENKFCLRSGWTNSTVVPVTCLPNRVQAVVLPSKKKKTIQIDGVAM